MNTVVKRMIVGVALITSLILVGCMSVPLYDSNGGYRGSYPAVDTERVGNMVSGAAVGAMAGAALGDPGAGAAFGAAIGGMSSGRHYPPPVQIYYPPNAPYYNQGYPQGYYNPPHPVCGYVDMVGHHPDVYGNYHVNKVWRCW